MGSALSSSSADWTQAVHGQVEGTLSQHMGSLTRKGADSALAVPVVSRLAALAALGRQRRQSARIRGNRMAVSLAHSRAVGLVVAVSVVVAGGHGRDSRLRALRAQGRRGWRWRDG